MAGQECIDDFVVFLGLARAGGVDEAVRRGRTTRAHCSSISLALARQSRAGRHSLDVAIECPGRVESVPKARAGGVEQRESNMASAERRARSGVGSKMTTDGCGRRLAHGTQRADRPVGLARRRLTIVPRSFIAAAIWMVLPPGDAHASKTTSPATGRQRRRRAATLRPGPQSVRRRAMGVSSGLPAARRSSRRGAKDVAIGLDTEPLRRSWANAVRGGLQGVRADRSRRAMRCRTRAHASVAS